MRDPPRLHFAAVPPHPFRTQLPAASTTRCLTLWAASLRELQRLPADTFAAEVAANESLGRFIRSYILQDDVLRDYDSGNNHGKGGDWVYSTGKEAGEVRRGVKAFLRRATGARCTTGFLDGRAVVKLPSMFASGAAARSVMGGAVAEVGEEAVKGYVAAYVKDLTAGLGGAAAGAAAKGKGKDTGREDPAVGGLQELCYLLMALPEVADAVLADEAFFEAAAGAHAAHPTDRVGEEARRLVFTAVLAGVQAGRYSAVIDFLFSLTAETAGPVGAYVAAVVRGTPLVRRLSSVDAQGFANRWKTVMQRLQAVAEAAVGGGPEKRLSRLPRRTTTKRKEGGAHAAPGLRDLQELFPDTDAGVLQAVLESVGWDVEAATAAMLDDGDLYADAGADTPAGADAAAEGGAPGRDELDELAVPTSRLYLGKRGVDSTADKLLADRSAAPSKERILAALQAFDSDDDERDDTYDAEDIGGEVDRSAAGDEDVAAASAEEERVLYRALVDTPGVFARDAVTRRGELRRKLREATGMSNEAVEGWKLMLDRDGGRRLRQLEIRYSREAGGDAATTANVPRTAWRKGADDEEEEGEGTGPAAGNAGGRRTAGPNDRTVRGQQRDHAPVTGDGRDGPRTGKKTAKARGEHSRKMQSAARDRQRSKKMAKGM